MQLLGTKEKLIFALTFPVFSADLTGLPLGEFSLISTGTEKAGPISYVDSLIRHGTKTRAARGRMGRCLQACSSEEILR